MAGPTPISEITFLGSDTRIASRVGRPFKRFLAVEAAGGLVLLAATAIALVWANSAWAESYVEFWHTEIEVSIGSYHLGGGHHLDLETFVNDGLMVVFFFVVGLEIKRELVTGQLKDPRAAALPAMAAAGGMIVPAAIYLAFNPSGPASDGWGIPMATDIAFAVGVMSLLGDRIGRQMKVFILSLAIVDDIGAIAVIALFYTNDISYGWLAAAVGIIVLIRLLRQMRVWYVPIYVVLGVALWLATFESGVHATIAGVVLGLMTPARPLQTKQEAAQWVNWLRDKGDQLFAVDIEYAAFHMRESTSVAERMETTLHPLSSFLIVPIFALANAGVYLRGGVLADAATSPVTWGVAMGLVVGKIVGITVFTIIGQKMPFTTSPFGMTRLHLIGLASVAGIGFTVSLFITGLAFTDEMLISESKIGILFASLVAGLLGLFILMRACRREVRVSPPPAVAETVSS
ncbi:MAG: Na+/H+ antiporter NhaA [Acidimicrobiales bacterium]